ncbi:MAG: hypothetical protein FJ303_23730 [Planctomycetes bacterium]|nr:hypothetical protein [Planctomycetota bacterium]
MIRLSLSVFALIALVTLFASSPAAQEAKGLKGTFSTMLMDEKWTIAFDGDKKFIVKKKDELMVEGTYKVTKDEIEFTDKKGLIAAPETVGTYRWKLENKKLTFTKIKDEVEGREKGLTSSPWTAEK